MRLSAKQSKKDTKVNKCPICGAIVDPTSGICPDCKHECSGLNANSLVDELIQQIKRAENPFSRTSVIQVVENFPIPSSRKDLLEILAFLGPKINPIVVGKRKKDLKAMETSSAYYHKFEECIMKAKTYYSNDPAFSIYFTQYRSFRPTKPKKNWFKFFLKAMLIVILGAVIFLILTF